MTEIFELFQNIKTWRAGDVRAPHKPLLILLAIAELKKGNRMLPFEAIEEKLKSLLFDFGPPRKNIRANYPFVRLAGDSLWEIKSDIYLKSTTDRSPSFLKDHHIQAGFTKEVADALLQNEYLVKKMECGFPTSLWALKPRILNGTKQRAQVR